MKKIFENVTITHRNGKKQLYDAIQVTKKGVYTGYAIKKLWEEKRERKGGQQSS